MLCLIGSFDVNLLALSKTIKPHASTLIALSSNLWKPIYRSCKYPMPVVSWWACWVDPVFEVVKKMNGYQVNPTLLNWLNLVEQISSKPWLFQLIQWKMSFSWQMKIANTYTSGSSNPIAFSLSEMNQILNEQINECLVKTINLPSWLPTYRGLCSYFLPKVTQQVKMIWQQTC